MQFVIASHNQNKIQELQRIIAVRGNTAIPYTDLIQKQQFPVEGESSYLENAQQKALYISKQLPHSLIIADDSGLQLEAYPEIMGVRTARDLAQCQTPHDYDQYILRLFKDHDRAFQMQTTIVCAHQGKDLATADGILRGQIAKTERGNGGDGFNRILIPDNTRHTLAEMNFRERYYFLTRARAVDQLLWQLKDNHN